MGLVLAALRRPITVLVLVVALALGAALSVFSMPRDIFPDLATPVVYLVQTWPGYSPAQMEGILVSKYEYNFLFIAGVEHVESKSVQGVSMMKICFHPGTDTSYALAQVTAMAYRSSAFFPPGTRPPFILRLDASSCAVAQMVFRSETRSDVEVQDLAQFRIRPILSTLPGVSAPPPIGGKVRMVVVELDPRRLQSYGMAPEEVAVALAQANVVLPEGVVRLGSDQLITKTNGVLAEPEDFNLVPLRSQEGTTVFLRDVGHAAEGGDIVTNVAHVNGKRAVYLPITKRADASTLRVIDSVRERLPELRAALPDDIELSLEFDQSTYVRESIKGLAFECILGALLTGLVVLVFLRDARSTFIVVTTIPIALLGALCGLALTGQTVNIMTLGGLALAVGILVDEATVAIENIHVHLARGETPAWAVIKAMREVMAPQLVAMLCVCAGFLPALIMKGTAGALFAPLALAVVFAMVASFMASTTVLPVLAAALLRGHDAHERPHGLFARLRAGYARLVERLLAWRRLVITGYALACVAALGAGAALPAELFPQVDHDKFQLRIRAPDGTRLSETERLVDEVLATVKEEAGPDMVEVSLANLGTVAPSNPVNAVFVWNSGPHEGVLLVDLKADRARSLPDFEDALRRKLAQRFPQASFSFEAGDVVSQVLNSGSPNPVNVTVSGSDFEAVKAHARKIEAELARVPEVRDVAIPLPLETPALTVDIDRERAGHLGVTTNRIARSLVQATWSSQLTQQILWVDRYGIAYYVALRLPEAHLDSLEAVRDLPVMPNGEPRPLLRDVAKVGRSVVPGEFDHWNSIRSISVTANAGTNDLRAVSGAVRAAIERAGPPPRRDIKVALHGQIEQMEDAFSGLARGLALAIVVVLLLLAATFESIRDALAILTVVPAVLSGVVVALLATRTSLNIQSFMGAITSVGVSVANAVLVVQFARERRRHGVATQRAVHDSATSRLRPILMTTLAMMAGMVPMALGLGEGGEQSAPLGRAVIGGIAASTVATLAVLPLVLAAIHGERPFATSSLVPLDAAPAPAQEGTS